MASKCTRGGLYWVLGKLFFPGKVVMHWNRLSRPVVELQSLEMRSGLMGDLGERKSVCKSKDLKLKAFAKLFGNDPSLFSS